MPWFWALITHFGFIFVLTRLIATSLLLLLILLMWPSLWRSTLLALFMLRVVLWSTLHLFLILTWLVSNFLSVSTWWKTSSWRIWCWTRVMPIWASITVPSVSAVSCQVSNFIAFILHCMRVLWLLEIASISWSISFNVNDFSLSLTDRSISFAFEQRSLKDRFLSVTARTFRIDELHPCLKTWATSLSSLYRSSASLSLIYWAEKNFF